MATLTKNPLYCMLDTETCYMSRQIYELAFVIFDSITCEVVQAKRFLISNTLKRVLQTLAYTNELPIFYPARMSDIFSLLKHDTCVEWEEARDALIYSIKKYSAKIIAHNVNFDINAIYATENKIRGMNAGGPFLANYEKLELSGFFVHGLPLMVAYNVPYKLKSGCLTFKADYLVPLLVGANQNHDALGDCYNQLELYKLTKGQYTNKGTIYHNMLAHHRLKHNDNKRLGNDSLE